jgi:muramoyltetrapeptide carboxypeptidase LdcA involved in peptidoglycan recycling
MVEDDATSDTDTFARNLTSLLQLPDASKVQAWQSAVPESKRRYPLLAGADHRPSNHVAGLPVLGNVDFGHTNPLATFPIGGRAELAIGGDLPGRVAENR